MTGTKTGSAFWEHQQQIHHPRHNLLKLLRRTPAVLSRPGLSDPEAGHKFLCAFLCALCASAWDIGVMTCWNRSLPESVIIRICLNVCFGIFQVNDPEAGHNFLCAFLCALCAFVWDIGVMTCWNCSLPESAIIRICLNVCFGIFQRKRGNHARF